MTDPSSPLHDVRFPNESPDYRSSRNVLLDAERELRRQVERVAALRRDLPQGGAVLEDYLFAEAPPNQSKRQVRFSELFGDKPALITYSFMFGPDDAAACPLCTSLLDGLDGTSRHIAERVPFVVIAKSPIERIMEHARDRGWRHLRLLSSSANSFNRDYRGEDEEGSQTTSLNVFTRRDGIIRHAYNTELFFIAPEAGQNPRHVDLMWPLWNLLDFTPEGRGTDWWPKLTY
jgi:predicted dithiol-disulfide oxidoreductase (DUF899 family)